MTEKTRKQRIEEMLAEAPHDPELRYALAMECISAGQDSQAVPVFQELIAANPTYVPAYYHFAKTLARIGQIEQARPVIERGIRAAKNQGDHHAAEELQGLLYTLE